MPQPLGSPEEQDVISVDENIITVTITLGLSSIEFQNTGKSDIVFGKASTLTFARGGLIYSQGDRKTFENIQAGWVISFRCDTGKSTSLRQIDYK